MKLVALVLLLALGGCAHRPVGEPIPHLGTDFNFTLTRAELAAFKAEPRARALALISKLNRNGVSRAILSSDATSGYLKEEEINALNAQVIEVSDLGPKIFAAACAINLKQFYWQEMRKCRLREVFTYVFDFRASNVSFDDVAFTRDFLTIVEELNKYQATILIRGEVKMQIPWILLEAIRKATDLKVVFSDFHFLYKFPKLFELPNVYLELSELQLASARTYRFEIQRLLRSNPASKFLYGSGMTFASAPPDPKWYRSLEMPASVFETSKKANSEAFDYLFTRAPIKREDP